MFKQPSKTCLRITRKVSASFIRAFPPQQRLKLPSKIVATSINQSSVVCVGNVGIRRHRGNSTQSKDAGPARFVRLVTLVRALPKGPKDKTIVTRPKVIIGGHA